MREQMAQQQAAALRTRRASLPSAGASSSRHHAGGRIGLHPEDRPYQNAERRPQRVRIPQPVPTYPEEEEDAGGEDRGLSDTRSHTSTRRYAPVSMRVQYQPMVDGRVHPAAIPARRSAGVAAPRRSPDEEQDLTPVVTRARAAPAARARLATLLLVLGVLLVVMLLGWMLLTWLLSWWGRVQDDWHYGMPRVERLTAVVGHADSAAHPSLFFAINDDGHAQVIECPGGDCSHARAYLVPVLISGDQGLTPVTITLKDVNGDGA